MPDEVIREEAGDAGIAAAQMLGAIQGLARRHVDRLMASGEVDRSSVETIVVNAIEAALDDWREIRRPPTPPVTNDPLGDIPF
jgi:hypothetical protein